MLLLKVLYAAPTQFNYLPNIQIEKKVTGHDLFKILLRN